MSTHDAVFHARIDTGGVSSFYRFDYIAEAAYLANQQAGGSGFAGAGRVPVPDGFAGKEADTKLTSPVSGLQQETAYRYRVVVRNAEGTATGPERRLETQGPGGALVLLDGRGWEMVSPVEKNGGGIEGPEAVAGGGVFQAAAQGGATTFSSVASFGPGAGGAPVGSQYVSRRGAGGWTVENVTPPSTHEEEPDGVPTSSSLQISRSACSRQPAIRLCPRPRRRATRTTTSATPPTITRRCSPLPTSPD